jgi:hypothetical protein
MMSAGHADSTQAGGIQDLADAWDAMLAAAPQPIAQVQPLTDAQAMDMILAHAVPGKALTEHPLINRARAECDRRGITDEDGLRQVLGYLTHKRFQEESDPWRSMALRVYQTALPVTTIYPNGTIKQHYNFSGAEQALLRTVDAAIAEIAKKYSLENTEYRAALAAAPPPIARAVQS